MSTPMGGYAGGSASGRATTAMILGVLGLICCGPLGLAAWWLGSAELDAIRSGQSPAAGEGMAQAGKIMGIIGSIMTCLGCLAGTVWTLFFGGLAVLQGMQH